MSQKRKAGVALTLVVTIGVFVWWNSTLDSSEPRISSATPTSVAAATGPSSSISTFKTKLAQMVSGGPAFRLRVIPSPPIPRGPLIGFLKEYQDAAARGDGDAAFVLARSLYLCKNVPTDDGGRTSQLEALRLDASARGYAAPEIDRLVLNLGARHSLCAGVEPELVAKWESYLDSGAELGSEYARYQFAHYTPEWGQVDPSSLTTDEYSVWAARSSERAEKSLAYLTALRDDDANIQAIGALGAQYYARRHQPDGYFNAYVNFRALEILSERADEEFLAGKQLAEAQSNLSPVDRDRAESLAQQIVSNPRCCSRYSPEHRWTLGSD